MGKRRPRLDPDAPWEQLKLRLTSDEQHAYELIRPIVLFGESIPARASETDTHERTLRRTVLAFEETGMQSLRRDPVAPFHRLPQPVYDLIVHLHHEHPPMRHYEISTICLVRLGYRPSAHTIKRLRALLPATHTLQRRFPPFHTIPDAFQRRRCIIVLHSDGWNAKSIAAYLQINRSTVYDTLKRWITDGVKGLHSRTRARHPRVRIVTLKTIHRIRDLQHNPLLGAWRMAAALKQQGIHLSPRTCGRIMAVNRDLYADLRPPKPVRTPKRPMPYESQRPHHFWSVDVRYLETPHYPGGQVYCISILDNASRAMLASAISPTQDLPAFLRVFYEAVRSAGSPEVLVSDSGSIFRAKRAQEIYHRLGVRKEYIAKRQPWQNYIETAFNIQRRMADVPFAEATTWEELLAVHRTWFTDYNTQDHWAHRFRDDGRTTPTEVLAWIRGNHHDELRLRRIFYTLRFARRINRRGYVTFRYWQVYSDEGAAGMAAAVWLYKDALTVSVAEESLAQYRVQQGRDPTTLGAVSDPTFYPSRHQSRQTTLDGAPIQTWRCLILKLPRREYRRRTSAKTATQLAFALDDDDDR